MIQNKKQVFIIIGAFVLTLLLGSTTYAFFNYTRTGSSNIIKVGRISFNTNQSETINLENVFPIDATEANTNTEYTDEAVITITGDTTYDNGIEYVIKVVDVNNLVGDKELPISLITTVDGIGDEDTDYFDNRDNFTTSKYTIINHEKIDNNSDLVIGYIAKGVNGINGTITLKAFIDKDKIAISDTYPATSKEYILNPNRSSNINECVTYLTNLGYGNYLGDNESLAEFCDGTGTLYNYDIYSWIENEWFYNSDIEELLNIGILIKNGTTSEWVNGRTVFTTEEWNSLQTNEISFQIRIEANEGIWVEDSSNLYNIVTKNAVIDNIASTYVSSSSGIDFSKLYGDTDNDGIIDNGKGVYLRAGTENDANPIYYYRGAVEDNNVYFGNYCWKIVRTSENGGIKMIYNGENIGTSNNPKCLKTPTSYDYEHANAFFAKANIDGDDKTWSTFNNNNIVSLRFNGYMYGDDYPNEYNTPVSGAYFGTGFSYVDGKYQLTDPVVGKDAYHHYTCNSIDPEEKCSTLYFYYYLSNYRFILTNGDDIDDVISIMQENKYESDIKKHVDTWYESNLTSYENKLDDAIWCNDRRMMTTEAYSGSGILNGFYPNGGESDVFYQSWNRGLIAHYPDFTCRKNDAFTMNESDTGNGELDYPVGLITIDEVILSGSGFGMAIEGNYLDANASYWTMSLYSYSAPNGTRNLFVGDSSPSYANVSSGYGVRPMISLKHDTKISSGNGTLDNPYIIE